MGSRGRALTILHVCDEIFLQGISADIRVAVVKITVAFAAVFATELLCLPARDGVEGVSLPNGHGGSRLLVVAWSGSKTLFVGRKIKGDMREGSGER